MILLISSYLVTQIFSIDCSNLLWNQKWKSQLITLDGAEYCIQLPCSLDSLPSSWDSLATGDMATVLRTP